MPYIENIIFTRKKKHLKLLPMLAKVDYLSILVERIITLLVDVGLMKSMKSHHCVRIYGSRVKLCNFKKVTSSNRAIKVIIKPLNSNHRTLNKYKLKITGVNGLLIVTNSLLYVFP